MPEQKLLNNTYLPMEQIGAGGNGVVYKAYHTRLNIYVAIKCNKPKVRGRLPETAEADILKNVKHRYLPRVYDIFPEGGDICTVIDFIPGESLDKVIAKNGPIAQERVYKWALQLAEALEYLHGMNPPVIHSDIKPANVMLLPNDDICLIDFNISLASAGGSGAVGVTGGYSPPEQYPSWEQYCRLTGAYTGPDMPTDILTGGASVTAPGGAQGRAYSQSSGRAPGGAYGGASGTASGGDYGRASGTASGSGYGRAQGGTYGTSSAAASVVGRGIDTRSDIYSLGATLYHMLTGIHPSADCSQIVPVDQCGVPIGEGFAQILGRMLDPDPNRRYRDGGELLYALQHVHELDSEYKRKRRAKRMKRIAAAACAAAAAVLIVGGVLVYKNQKNVRYNKLIVSAEESLDSGDYDTAAELAVQAQELLPKKAEAYCREVQALYLSGDYETCISRAEELIRNQPYTLEDDSALGELYYILGNAYLETEEYGSAASCLEKAVSYEAENGEYYRDYAVALAQCGKLDAAEETLETAVGLGLGEASVYLVQGEIAYAQGSYEETVSYAASAISGAGTDSLRRRAVLLCDRAYRALGTDYLDAEIAMLEEAVSASANVDSAVYERLADAYVRKADVFSAADEADEAAQYYEAALEIFADIYDSGYVTEQLMENIAILCENLDEFDAAEEMLLLMAERYANSYVAYKRLAYLEADRQQEEENADRDYTAMAQYYAQAQALYDESEGDSEMDMLAVMMQEVEDGGWLD